jgi:DNA-binding CsgD family transcriptional regulator
VSYIISELFLLGLYLFMQEEAHTAKAEEEEATPPPAPEALYAERVLAGLSELTQTEQRIFECYLDGMRTHEILDALGITENTLKYHNKNLYPKFGVSSRRDLMELYKKSGIEASQLQE